MTHNDITLLYSNLVRETARAKNLGELLQVIAQTKIFSKQLPSEYLWMVDSLNEQANQKKVRLVAFNEYLTFKAQKTNKKRN